MEFNPLGSLTPSSGDSGPEEELDPTDAFAPSPVAPDEDFDNQEGPEFEQGMEVDDFHDSDEPECEPIEEDEEEKEYRPSPSGDNVVGEVPSSSNSATTPELLDATAIRRRILKERRCPVCKVKVSKNNDEKHLKGRRHQTAMVRIRVAQTDAQNRATDGNKQLNSETVRQIIYLERRCLVCKVTVNKGQARVHLKSRKHKTTAEWHRMCQAAAQSSAAAASAPTNGSSSVKRSNASAPTPTEGSEQMDAAEILRIIDEECRCPLCDVRVSKNNSEMHLKGRKHQAAMGIDIPQTAFQISAAAAPAPANVPSQAKRSDASVPSPTEGIVQQAVENSSAPFLPQPNSLPKSHARQAEGLPRPDMRQASSQMDAATLLRIIDDERRCPVCDVRVGNKNAEMHLKGRKHQAALLTGIHQDPSVSSAPTPIEESEQSEEPLDIDMLDSGALKQFITSIRYCPLCDVAVTPPSYDAAPSLSHHVMGRRHQLVLTEQIRIARMPQLKDLADKNEEEEDGQGETRILLGKGTDYLPDNLRECLCRYRCRICTNRFTSPSAPEILRHYNSTRHQWMLHLRSLPTGVVVTTAPISHRRNASGQLIVQVPAVRAIIRIRTENSNQDQESNQDEDNGLLSITSFKGEGVSDLPEELLRLFRTKHCSRCDSTFSKATEALEHFNQTSHQVELMRQGLPAGLVKLTGPLTVEKTSDDTGVLVVPMVEKIAELLTVQKFTGEGAADMPPTLRSLYMGGSCPLCDYSIVNCNKFLEHYNSNKHQRQLEKEQLPIGFVTFKAMPKFSTAEGHDRVLMVPKMTSPPPKIKRLTGEGAPNLPENLRELILTHNCRLCSHSFSEDALTHFNKNGHQSHLENQGLPYGTVHLDGPLRPFTSEEGEQLVEVPKVSTPPKPKPAIFTGPGATDLPDNAVKLIRTLYCSHCRFGMEDEVVAMSHYNGFRHQDKLQKGQLPVGYVYTEALLKVTTNANGERVVNVPPISPAAPQIQRLGGEGAKDVPDNLRELLLSFHCRFCLTDLHQHVNKVFRHYNSPPHMTKLGQAKLPQIRVVMHGPFSWETVDGESVLMLPRLFRYPWDKSYTSKPNRDAQS